MNRGVPIGRRGQLAIAVLQFSVAPCAALAQQSNSGSAVTLEEIIVTATRRAENAQTVPISITPISQQTLQEMGADRFEDYTSTVPGLVYASGGSNTGAFEMRGIATSTLPSNTQSPVAVYYDDMPALASYAPGATPDLRLFDINHIEVLRGPQGTLFGSGALSGAIRIITNKPDLSEFHATAEVSGSTIDGGGGSYGTNAMVNIPLIDGTLGLRVVGYSRQDGGWIDNTLTHKDDQNSGSSYGARAMVRWKPVDELNVTGFVSYQNDLPEDANWSFYSASPRQFDNPASQETRLHTVTGNLSVDYSFNNMTLTSSTTYRTEWSSSAVDFTPVNSAVFGISTPAPDVTSGPYDSVAQELRLASNSTGRLQWLVGAFYLGTRRDLNEQIYAPGAGALLAHKGFPSDYLYDGNTHITTSEAALFGEVSYNITSELKATVGFRGFHDTFHLDGDASGIYNGRNTSVARRSTDSGGTPKFALSYQLIAPLMVYAQAAEGYRVGASDISPPVDPVTHQPIPQTYSPDKLWNYEVGMKSMWFDQRLQLNLAAYYIDWRDIQLQIQSPGHLTYLTNAGNAYSRGAELELHAKPVNWFELGTALSVNGSELYQLAPGVVGALAGDTLPGAPKFTASDYVRLSAPLVHSAQGYIRVAHTYMSKAYANLHNPTSLVFGDYNSFDARLGVLAGRWEVVGFVNNIGNSDGKVAAASLPDGHAAARLQPRTVGATLRYSY